MRGKTSIDTNILVYCFDASEPEKKKKALKTIDELRETSSGLLSLQVLKEFFVTVTEKFPQKMNIRDAKTAVIHLLSWESFFETRSSLEKSIDFVQKHRFSFWDANILSAAILFHCRQIYSEDFQHHQTLEGLQIINPLL